MKQKLKLIVIGLLLTYQHVKAQDITTIFRVVYTNADGTLVMQPVNLINGRITTPEPTHLVTRIYSDTNHLVSPLTQSAPMYGTNADASEIALHWEINTNCTSYIVEYRSEATTNQWIKAGTFRPLDGQQFVNASIYVGLDEHPETRIYGVTAGGRRTPPTEPVKHPSMADPGTLKQHQQWWVQPRTNKSTVLNNWARRNRMEPLPTVPATPLP